MGEIKSALEIALERTKNVKVDKEVLEADKYTKEGRKKVSVYLDNHDGTLEGALDGYGSKEKGWIKGGIFEALAANLILPVDQFALKKNQKVCLGFYAIIPKHPAIEEMFGQLDHFFQDYIEQRGNLRSALEKQWEPKLRQKEEELSRQMGGDVRLEASQDPEFVMTLKQAMAQLDDRYSQILVQVKGELKNMMEASK